MRALNGWFKFHRAMLEHPVWNLSDGQFKVWVTCLTLANHKPGEWWDGLQRVEIPAGSFITSQPNLAKAAGVSRIVVRHALSNLEVLGSIRAKAQAKRWTLIEVVNWPIYQGGDDEVSQEVSPRRAKDEPSASHNVRREEGKKNFAGAGSAPAAEDGKGTGPEKKPRKTHPETDTLLAEFGALFEKKRGTPYLATFARDKKLLHDMLTASGVEEVRSRMTAFLTYGTKRTRDLGDYSIPAFRAAWNELGVLKARGDL